MPYETHFPPCRLLYCNRASWRGLQPHDSLSLNAAPRDRAVDGFGRQLGTVAFDVSGNEAARAHVVRGVKLLHHMTYFEADREFAAAVAADPDCALAYWGRAMCIIHPLWPDVPNAADLKQGAEFVAAGLAGAPKTPRERAYLMAMEAYYRDAPSREEAARLKALDEAWARLAASYPDDLDAAAFSALFHLAPARFLPKDKSRRIQLEAGATLKAVLGVIPDHPGALHYTVHAYDFPLLANRALEICETYGSITPDVPHALHMPTHIFTRRGLWEKSIEFNRRASDAARKLGESTGVMSFEYPHTLDYLVYAYLQRGQNRNADAIRRALLASTGPYDTVNRPAIAFAFAAIPARCALERSDWAAAAQLEPRRPASFPWGEPFLNCESITHFARALGAVRSGKLDTARRAIEEQERLNRRIAAAHPGSYWASQAETQLLATRAWLRLKEGDTDEAVALMRRAAELEDTSDKEAVTPGEVRPARELLGDMLFELQRYREALAAYEGVLQSSPNRLNSIYGAARAAELGGRVDEAARYDEQLVKLTSDADPGIEPLKRAKAFLAAR